MTKVPEGMEQLIACVQEYARDTPARMRGDRQAWRVFMRHAPCEAASVVICRMTGAHRHFDVFIVLPNRDRILSRTTFAWNDVQKLKVFLAPYRKKLVA